VILRPCLFSHDVDSQTEGARSFTTARLSPQPVPHSAKVHLRMSVVVFWVVTPCGLVGGQQRFVGTCCLNVQPWRWKQYVTPFKSTRCHNPEDDHGLLHRRRDLKSRPLAQFKEWSHNSHHKSVSTRGVVVSGGSSWYSKRPGAEPNLATNRKNNILKQLVSMKSLQITWRLE
jgi:hypothetical protein